MTEYVDEFVQESEESITELNNTLLELERDPDDDEAMEAVFRTAHTLKGNCGAMGFDAASDLAHAIEDLLDAVRAGSLSITPALMDDVFDAVDDLERMIGEVDRHGEVTTDPTARIEALRDHLETAEPSASETEAVLAGSDRRPRDDHRAFHARLSLAGDEADADAALRALSDAFDVLATDHDTDPAPVTAGGDGESEDGTETLDVVFGSAVGEEAVAAALDPVNAVDDAVVTEVDPAVVDRALSVDDDVAEEVSPASGRDPMEMDVDELLEEFDEYDDLDEAVRRVEDVPGLENMGEAGAFDDVVETDVEAVRSEDPTGVETDTSEASDETAADPRPAGADEEIEDAATEFEQMKETYDRVGLEEIETELEDVEFGEFDQDDEVGFDDLLDDEVLEESDAGSAAGDPEPPEEDAIEALVAAAAPATLDHDVHHVRLSVSPEDGAGETVVKALRDAFNLLGTDPDESAVVDGDHDRTVDALFGSALSPAETRTALEDLDAVAGVHLTDVTERVEPREAAKLDSEPGTEPEPDAGSASSRAASGSDAETDETDPGVDPAVIEAEGEIEDAATEFEQMKETYDRVGLEEIETELEDVEFGEFDQDDEVGFEELLEPATSEGGTESGAPTAETGADEGPTAETETGPGSDGEEPTVSADAPDESTATTEAGATEDVEVADGESTTADADPTGEEPESASGTAASTGKSETGEITDETSEPEPEIEPEPESEPEPDADGETDPDTDDGDTDLDEVEVGEISLEDIEVGGDLDDISVSPEFGVDVDVDAGPVTGEPDSAGDAGREEGSGHGGTAGAEDDAGSGVGSGSTTGPGDSEGAETASGEAGGTDAGVRPETPEGAEADVESIAGIGPNYAERLATRGVRTVRDLVVADVDELATETDISASRIREWVERAPVSAEDLPTGGSGVERPGAAGDEHASVQSVRVDIDRIDELLTLVEGLVTSRARMRRVLREEGVESEALQAELDELDGVATEMRDLVMDMRLVPVGRVTGRLPRVVRDVARDQGKRVDLAVEGEDVEVDRSIVSRLSDPLVHLVRNAVDHGIESPERRREVGKPEEGQVTLRVRRTGSVVIVEVEDDGRGIDADELREEAVQRDVLTAEEAADLSDRAARELILRPGFSTTEEVTEVSGRGVGMDVVASTVEDLDGEVEIESEPGAGTTVRLVLPVSVAISDVLFVEVGDEEYGIPIRVVDEVENGAAAEPVADGGEVVRTPRGEERELVDLGEAMGVPGRADNGTGDGMLVTLESNVRRATIRCDRVRGQQEVVVRPFEGFMSGIPGVTGAAVLGEGSVTTILDVETL